MALELFVSHTLQDPADLFARNGNQLPKTYQSLVGLIKNVPKPVKTFEGFEDGKSLKLPEELADRNVEILSKDGIEI